jgi:hypothetical protein
VRIGAEGDKGGTPFRTEGEGRDGARKLNDPDAVAGLRTARKARAGARQPAGRAARKRKIFLNVCKRESRDAANGGVPCESLCSGGLGRRLGPWVCTHGSVAVLRAAFDWFREPWLCRPLRCSRGLGRRSAFPALTHGAVDCGAASRLMTVVVGAWGGGLRLVFGNGGFVAPCGVPRSPRSRTGLFLEAPLRGSNQARSAGPSSSPARERGDSGRRPGRALKGRHVRGSRPQIAVVVFELVAFEEGG